MASVLPASPLPDRARIVIVGGGIIGASIAYHLTQAGETDVVLLERGRLTNGTTWHAAGLVSRVRGTHALTELTRDNVATYERVAAETGVDLGLRHVGALTIARTEARMHEILAGVGMARDFDIPVEVDRPRAGSASCGPRPSSTISSGACSSRRTRRSTRATRRSRSRKPPSRPACATCRRPRSRVSGSRRTARA